MSEKKIAVISKKDLDGLFPIMVDMIVKSQSLTDRREEIYLKSFLSEVVRPAFSEDFLYREIPAEVYENGHKMILDDPSYKKYVSKKRR